MLIENNITYQKAYAFAVCMVNAFKYLQSEKRAFILSKQLLHSGTSIGANIAEANGAISNADFFAKMSIPKEYLETKYWLNLLKDTAYIDEKMYISVYEDADELVKILYTILRKMRNLDK